MVKLNIVHAGHGGVDPGAVGNGYTEAAVARLYSNDLVKLTGAIDATDNTATSVSDNLSKIVNNVNRHATDNSWNVSIHLNAATPAATGVEVFYYGGDAEGASKAAEISAKLAQVYGIPNRGAKDGSGLYVLRNTKGHALLIELGFISNSNDIKMIIERRPQAVAAIASCFEVTGNVAPPTAPQPYRSLNTSGYIRGKGYYKVSFPNRNQKDAEKLAKELRQRYSSLLLGEEVMASHDGSNYTITAKGLTKAEAVLLVPKFQRAVQSIVPNYKATDTYGSPQPNGSFHIVASNIRTLNEATLLVPALQKLSADALLKGRIYSGRQTAPGVYFTAIINLSEKQGKDIFAKEAKLKPVQLDKQV